jgi:sulfoxide reductase heme-binding subunit YedZ
VVARSTSAAVPRAGWQRWLLHPLAKPAVFLVCLLPFASLVVGIFTDTLGANPAEALVRATGEWTLRMLCLVLLVTPLRAWTGWPAWLRFRRMVGLFVYFYVVLHALCYAWFDMGFELADILRDIAKRPFILVGTAALLLLTPLALTSFNRAIRALGARRWQRLHRLVYAVAALALLHFFWMRAGKNNQAEVAVYGLVIGALLGWRLWHAWRRRQAARD